MTLFLGRTLRLGLVGAGAWLVAAVPASAGPLTQGEQRQIHLILKQADAADQSNDPVAAFLKLREALRLEQLWSHNTLVGETAASRQMERFSTALVRRDNDRLLRVLHSRQVALPDKLSLIRLLEEEIIMRYPGRDQDVLLQGYDE